MLTRKVCSSNTKSVTLFQAQTTLTHIYIYTIWSFPDICGKIFTSEFTIGSCGDGKQQRISYLSRYTGTVCFLTIIHPCEFSYHKQIEEMGIMVFSDKCKNSYFASTISNYAQKLIVLLLKSCDRGNKPWVFFWKGMVVL